VEGVHVHANEGAVFDHRPISMHFRVPHNSAVDMDLESGHVCGAGNCLVKQCLHWRHEKVSEYVEHIENNIRVHEAFSAALRVQDVEQACCCIRSLIIEAAVETGMAGAPKCMLSKRKRMSLKRPVWFDQECVARKLEFKQAVASGQAKHAWTALKKQNRNYYRGRKRQHERLQRCVFLDRLQRKDPAVHALLTKNKGSQPTPVSECAWKGHLEAHFRPTSPGQPEESRPARTLHARDLAVPLGRRHPAPETLLRQAAQAGWVPQPDDFSLPDVGALEELTMKHIKRLGVDSSSGFECITPPFLKYALRVVGSYNDRVVSKKHVLLPCLSQFFQLILAKGCVPSSWKSAKLTPLHKKGPVLNPANYRMIAVSGTMYRLFANVLRDLVTEWCEQRKKIPDTQFGFYPGRSTLQPIFILRHLKHAASALRPHGSPRLHAAFIDFTQAYDTIPREKLWQHLQRTQMPSLFLSLLKNIYESDEYILVDGSKKAHVQPIRGVKQGCPLSPLLFSLYINDIDQISEGIEGALTGDGDFRITHMLYADDLCLTVNEPQQMQKMLDRLQLYSRRKGLIVNVGKSEVVHFNSRKGCVSLPTFTYEGNPLVHRDSFRYLGMVFTHNLNLEVAAEHAVRPYLAAIQRVKGFARAYGLSDRPDAMIWLSKIYAVSAGMYGSQIWGTRYLRAGTEFDSRLQKHQLCFLRRVLGVKGTTSNWCVLRECGQDALQFYWFRAAIRFFNSSIETNSYAMKRTLYADVKLSVRSKHCWSAHVLDAFKNLRRADVYRQGLLSVSPFYMKGFESDVRFRHQTIWREVDGLDPRMHGKKAVAYHNWCAVPMRCEREKGPLMPLPLYMKTDLPKHIRRNVSCFRLQAHRLRVETARFCDGAPNVCDKCGSGDIQDEKHVLFHCSCRQACELRAKYSGIFDHVRGLQGLAAVPFLPVSVHVDNNMVMDFLGKNCVRLYKYVSDILDVFAD